MLDDPLRDFGTYQPLGAPEPGARRRVEAAPDLLRRRAEGGLHLRRRSEPAPMDLQVNLVRVQRRPDRAELGSARQRSGHPQPGDLERERRRPGASRRAGTPSASARSARRPRGCGPPPPRRTTSRSRSTGTCSRCAARHDFGGGGAHFGAGRSGHSHQGQDVFAACGTPLVAARGGKVKFAGFHAAAGYYVVIDGKGTDVDYAYMHLRQRAAVQVGDSRLHGPGPGRGRRDRQRARAATCTSRNGPRPGLVRRRAPVDPLPTSSAGTGPASVDAGAARSPAIQAISAVPPSGPAIPTRSCWAASRRCRARRGSRAGSR